MTSMKRVLDNFADTHVKTSLKMRTRTIYRAYSEHMSMYKLMMMINWKIAKTQDPVSGMMIRIFKYVEHNMPMHPTIHLQIDDKAVKIKRR